MKMVVAEVGKPAEIVTGQHIFQRARELFGEPNFDKAHLGGTLYLIVGDTAALADDRKENFFITNGLSGESVYGNALFIQRISGPDGLDYHGLEDDQANTIAKLLNENRSRLNTQELADRLDSY